MQKKKFNGFNDEGCLPFGVYEMTLNEFEDIFSKDKSLRRQENHEILQATPKANNKFTLLFKSLD